jgi:hypothetical protein
VLPSPKSGKLYRKSVVRGETKSATSKAPVTVVTARTRHLGRGANAPGSGLECAGRAFMTRASFRPCDGADDSSWLCAFAVGGHGSRRVTFNDFGVRCDPVLQAGIVMQVGRYWHSMVVGLNAGRVLLVVADAIDWADHIGRPWWDRSWALVSRRFGCRGRRRDHAMPPGNHR